MTEEEEDGDGNGLVWHERYAWHDARGLLDTLGREALFEPEPSLESGNKPPLMFVPVDPWITDARKVRELPLRAHEAEAIDTAAMRHRLL
jgi:hypothetical protein